MEDLEINSNNEVNAKAKGQGSIQIKPNVFWLGREIPCTGHTLHRKPVYVYVNHVNSTTQLTIAQYKTVIHTYRFTMFPSVLEDYKLK